MTNKIKTDLEKSLVTKVPTDVPNQEAITIDDETPNSATTPIARIASSGANFDGTHGAQKLTIGGLRPGQPPPTKSYANTAKANLEAGLPVGAPPTGQKYNHKQNNKATFDRMEAEGPVMVRRDYATFPDGHLKWNVHYEPKKPELTEQQKKRRKTKWEIDRAKTDKEVIIFMIPTRDAEGKINSRDYDNFHVVRLFKELARGGYFIKPGDIAGTIRQIQNDRHPHHLPITVTCKDKETAENVINAASNIYLNGGRRAKHDDEEKGRFGFFRPSLSEQERKAIKDKKKERETPHGKGQAEIRQRKYDSHTGAEEWDDLIRDEYRGENEFNEFNTSATADGGMAVVDPEVPTTPIRIDEDENQNTPPVTAAPTQSAQEKETEKLKKQLEEVTKNAESMAKLNDQYRKRNATLEELNKKKD